MTTTAVTQLSNPTVNGTAKVALATSPPVVNGTPTPLFACTRCNSRHPFEELSPDLMLCKHCRDAFVLVKCTFCRSEFQQDSKSNLTSVCRKCDLNVKTYGKPTSCEYCNIIAAFIGSKCQRCAYSEKKYGPPVHCEQCKQRCAFDRKDGEMLKKVDGKLLCWLCTMSYKRALAKATKHKETNTGRHHNHNSTISKRSSSSSNRSHSSSHSSRFKSEHGKHSNGNHSNHSSHSNGVSNGTSTSNGSSNNWDVVTAPQSSKKARVDYVKSLIKTSNGTFLPAPATSAASSSSNTGALSSVAGTAPVTTTTSAFNGDNGGDIINTSDNVVAVTQLREKIMSLDRQLKAKNQELLKKDVKITELKSEINKEQRDCREKIQTMQKSHTERINEMQAKITLLSKQLANLSKTGKKGSKESNKEGSDGSPASL